MRLYKQAKTLLFDQLARKESISSDSLLQFMLLSKLNACVVREFLNGSTINCNNSKFEIFSKNFHKNLSISKQVLITILKLLQLQRLRIVIECASDLEDFKCLLPYLDGVTKLKINTYSHRCMPYLYNLFPRLRELECNFGFLELPNLPVLKLEKLAISDIIQNNEIDMSFIFRHRIKIVDIPYQPILDDEQLLINQSIPKRASFEYLILRVEYGPLLEIGLPIVVKYCETFPKLEKLDLKIKKSSSEERIPLFGTAFVSRCDEIISLKNRVKHLISDLTVDLSNTINVFYDDEYQSEWEMVLSKARQFGEILIDKEENRETIKVAYFEKTDQMSFKFNLQVTLVVHEETDEEMTDEGSDLEMEVDEEFDNGGDD